MKYTPYLLLIAAALLSSGCEKDTQTLESARTPASAQQASRAMGAEEASAFSAQLGLIAYTSYSQATQKAQELDSRLQSFLYHPNPMSASEVRQAWREAYSAYLQTSLFTFLPINDPPDWFKQNIDLQHTLMLLDSWPIEGGYIDYLPGYPFSGIVNDLTLELNEESLLSQHGFSDPSYASLGFHAYEFMLWGGEGQRSPRDFFPQENSAPVVIPSEGGHMPQASDAASAGNAESTESGDQQIDSPITVDVQNHNRRRQYVQVVSDQLLKHLHRLQRRWEPSNGYYATLVQRSAPEQVVSAALMATQSLLSQELLGRRLSGNSSEFSQSTWQDVEALVKGIQQLFLSDNEDKASGLHLLLNEPVRSQQTSLWRVQFAQIDEALAQWRTADTEANRQQCRQRLIELMSLLRKTASQLNIRLTDD